MLAQHGFTHGDLSACTVLVHDGRLVLIDLPQAVDLAADPHEQRNVADAYPDVVQELQGRLDAWLARRLAETGRDTDPLAEQGVCATRIGTPKPGEKVGPGATPLAQRAGQAAGIPAPDELNAPSSPR